MNDPKYTLNPPSLQPQNVNNSSELPKWVYLQAPSPGSANKFAYSDEAGRLMYICVTPSMLQSLLEHGWREVLS